MATPSSEPADGLQIAPLSSRAQFTAAFYPARPDSKSGGLQNEIEAFDRARDPAEHEISFGPYRLLPARRLLLEGDEPVPIGGRALDLLIALVERPGVVVSKAELIAQVWPHTFVDEGNLKVRIAALRRARRMAKAATDISQRSSAAAIVLWRRSLGRPAQVRRQHSTRQWNPRATFRRRWCD